MKVLKRSFVFLIVLLSLTACTSFKKGRLTVTHIHDNIYFNQTTNAELVELYGEPDVIEEDIKRVLEMYDEDNGAEVSTKEDLADYTDYIETTKGVKANYPNGERFDAYVEYRGNNLGLEYVRFYIKDGYIRSHFYGNITSLRIARQDKYLKQVLDNVNFVELPYD